MYKNPHYVYGPTASEIPMRLNYGEFILKNLMGHKDGAAFVNGVTNESISYREVAQLSMNVAISLVQLGVRKGDVVAICSENRLEFFPAAIGTICAGAAISPISTAYTKDEVQNAMNISKPKYIFCSPTSYGNIGKILKTSSYIKQIILFGSERIDGVLLYNDLAIPNNDNVKTHNVIKTVSRNVKYEEFISVDVQGHDIAIILYSSGTTGLPKGVVLTHYNIICAMVTLIIPNPGCRSLLINPWYHCMGFLLANCNMIDQRTTVFLPKFNVDLFLETIEKYKIQWVAVVPQILVALCKSPIKQDVSSVTILYSGAAPLREDVTEAALKKFRNAKVLQVYGMTESTAPLTEVTDLNKIKNGSTGFASRGCIIKVVDLETGKPLGRNQKGEICVKGSFIMRGYLDRDTNEGFDDEGFYRTGDIGYYDEEKYFYIVDRLKDIIKYKGYQVAPAEIESVLLQHEDVVEAAVVGVSSPTAGEVPLGFVVARYGTKVTASELQQLVAQKLSHPKHLRGGVRFLDALPKTASGKILKRHLKNMAETQTSKL